MLHEEVTFGTQSADGACEDLFDALILPGRVKHQR